MEHRYKKYIYLKLCLSQPESSHSQGAHWYAWWHRKGNFTELDWNTFLGPVWWAEEYQEFCNSADMQDEIKCNDFKIIWGLIAYAFWWVGIHGIHTV